MHIIERLHELGCDDYKDGIRETLMRYLSLKEYNALYKKFKHEGLTLDEESIIAKAGA